MQVPEVSESTTHVWIFATGKEYHSVSECGTMNPDKATKMTKDEAVSRGYSACSKGY